MVPIPAHEPNAEFVCDVQTGLSKAGQKELHSKYLYDELGSALFDAITALPEYGLTRADTRVLRRCAPEIAGRFRAPLVVAELGSGCGRKTRTILEALDQRAVFYPIDVSRAALESCRREVETVADVHPLPIAYLDGMREVAARRPPDRALLVLFLGSNIGNFERRCGADFLRQLRQFLLPGDGLLIGADLVKPAERMLAAYDDPTGVTAAFNLNLLGRVNRELGGDFDLRLFEHQAIWNASQRRIEMYLRSRVAQTVTIRLADLTVRFRADETIWTESSHKFDREELNELAAQTGFRAEAQWVDEDWPFAENLWMAAA